MSSEDRFGFEWQKYSYIDPNYETQFKKWVYPLTREDFKGKRILDAGCGMGRNSFWAKQWGACGNVAFDYDKRSIKSARKNLEGLDNTNVEFKSIYEIDWKNEFDIVFSIGVIHHLENPQKAIGNLIRATKHGGKILIWVYGYEGNEWIVRFITPIRKAITSRLPVRLVHFLTHFLSIPVFLFIKIFKGPGPYFKQLSKFKFWHIHSIIFDQLIPKIANYWNKEEARKLLTDFDEIEDVQIYQVNNNSWTILGKKEVIL